MVNDMYVYDKMRDSKLPWLKEIPTHWRITRMKEILQNVSEKNHPDATVLSLYREHGVLPKDSRDDNHNVTSLDTASYKFVRVGELVINKMKAWQGSLGVSDYEGIVSPAYYVCKFKSNDINKKYFHYLVRCKLYAQEFERLSTGMRVGQWDLSIDDFMATQIIIPPVSEQSAIVAYLDDQISRIDSIIAEAKTSIEEYKQWKASIIFEAVTKGLAPDVEMRDSEIAWIGSIPAHWHKSRIKNEFDNLDYMREPVSAEKRENKLGLYDYYGASGVIDKIDDYNIDDEVLLIGEDGANLKMRNLPLIYKAKGKIWVNNHAHILRVSAKNNYNFMYYLLEAGDYNDYITGTAQPKLSQSNLMSYPICIPPSEEQEKIGNFLDEKCSIIDSIIKEKESLIGDLEQYKRSLIYEVVTGKQKVV